MRNSSNDVVERSISVLDDYGLGDLSMRRIAADLGVQPSALYHHFASKQLLLAAVADEILARGAWSESRPVSGSGEADLIVDWADRVAADARALRNAMLAYRDGAELVATVYAFGLGARRPYERLLAGLEAGGFDAVFAPVAASTLLHFVFGHVLDEQTHLQAGSIGAIDGELRSGQDDSFAMGLMIVLDGIRAREDALPR